MKRKMTIFRRCLMAFACGMLLVGGVSMSASPRVSINVCGDVTGEGVVDVADVNAIINIILELKTSADYPGNADASGDNVVDVSDVNTVINIILGLDPVVTEYTIDDVTFKMVEVEGGTFTMGAPEDDPEAIDREKPAHQVTLSDFSIAETEVTQELWVAVMGNNPSWFNGYNSNDNYDYGTNLQRPVEQVTWFDCEMFIAKLNQLTGKTFRLPTDAQWEFAAHGGNKSKGCKYAGSNNIDDVAWYYNNAYSVGVGSPDFGTHAVATKAPNELGLYDMNGNVREWCQDWYEDFSSSAQTNPTGPESGENRVTRSSDYVSRANRCRNTYRAWAGPTFRDNLLGFRLAQ